MRETRDWWNATAEYFQAEADVPVGVHYGPGAPDDGGLGLLGDLAGAEAVELGCGGAQCAVGLARRGATVTGVDLSTAQLAYARDLIADHPDVAPAIDLVQGDVTALPLGDDAADLAFSAYALQWVEDLEACFREGRRVLRADGALVVSLPHPFYQVLDPDEHTPAHSYHDPGPERAAHEGIDPEQATYRRRVSDVHGALRAAGFAVDRLLEPASDDPEDYDQLWEFRPDLTSRVPPTLVVRAVPDPHDP